MVVSLMPGNPTSLFVNALLLKSKYLPSVASKVNGDDWVPLPAMCSGTIGRKSITSLSSVPSYSGIIL